MTDYPRRTSDPNEAIERFGAALLESLRPMLTRIADALASFAEWLDRTAKRPAEEPLSWRLGVLFLAVAILVPLLLVNGLLWYLGAPYR